MNFFDRQILPAVQEKIRKDWNLSDSVARRWIYNFDMLLHSKALNYNAVPWIMSCCGARWRRNFKRNLTTSSGK